MQIVNVDFSKDIGKIKPMHGVDNGPRTHGFTHDHTQHFIEMGIPYCRLHDAEHPLGGGYYVNVPQIFRDFSKDPKDPDAYDFRLTDEYLKSIKDAGADIIYRLGSSIENEAALGKGELVPPQYINPPEDFDKWARICEGIIAHYNEGWANGFHMDITYWEIWGEPDSEALWTGTRWEFYDLYIKAATHLKNRFPNIKIGGFGGMGFYDITKLDGWGGEDPFRGLSDFNRDFLYRVKETNTPLDFYSWHLYSEDPEEYIIHSRACREMLDEFGFTECESIMDEWNMGGNKDAESTSAYITAILSTIQNTNIAIANYYDAQPYMLWWCGLFSWENGEVRKGYYAFKAFNELYKLGTQVKDDVTSGLYSIAAKNENEGAILISNYNKKPERICIDVKNFKAKDGIRVLVYAIDEKYNLEIIKEELITGDDFNLYINPLKDEVLYLEIKQA